MGLRIEHIQAMAFEPGDEFVVIQAFQQGNQSAFKAIYKKLFLSLCIFANNMIGDKEEAEDIVADSFVKLWSDRDEFNFLSSIRAYLYTVTKNACLNHIKHIKRKNASHKEILYLAKDGDTTFELQMLYAELIVLINKEIEKLPPLAKQVIKMSYQDGMKPDEIADQLKIPVQNVRNNKSRAIELLRIKLKKKNITPEIIMAVLNYLLLK